MENLISVVVPVYNCDKFLLNSIESILNQTYKNLELIVVNDGSTDNSLKILEKIQKTDKRLKIISQKNSGVSVARNIGIREAIGKYILFIDADDWIESDYIEILVKNCEKYNLDICRTGFYVDRKNGKNEKISFSKNKSLIIDVNDVKANFLDTTLFHSSCVQMINLDIIKNNNIYFNKNIIYEEDLLFNLELFKKCKNIMYIDCCKYHYLANDESSTRNLKNASKIINSIITANCELIKATEVYGNYEKDINTKHLKIIVMYLWQLFRQSYKDFRQCKKDIDIESLTKIFKRYNAASLDLKIKIKKLIIQVLIF